VTRTYEFRPDGAFFVWVSVHISDTRKEMLAYIKRFFERRGSPIEDDPGTAAQNTPTSIRGFPPYKGSWYCDRFTNVFLNHQDIRRNPHEIIPHEALHAAMTHERQVQHFDMCYSPDGDTIDDEERLAYKVGQIAAGLHRTLAKDRKARAKKIKRIPLSTRRNRAKKGK
jgi:hypothetical protein